MSDFNWADRQIKCTPQFVRAIAEERGINESTVEGLFKRGFIGGVHVSKWNEPTVAFPIRDEHGNIFRAHCRNPYDHKNWVYEPFDDPEKRPISALVYGDFEKALKVYVFESQWDAIALIDVLNLFDEIDSGEACLIATRGANNYRRLTQFTWAQNSDKKSAYTFAQNDGPGQKWLENVIEITCGAYVVPTPAHHNDVGEWLKDGGATAYDIESAIEYSEFRRRPDPSVNGQQEPEAEPKPLLPMRSWIYYSDLEVDVTKFLMGTGFLEPGNFVVLVGASYAGKSTLAAQLSVYWAMGSSCFSIKIPRPLRTIFFQAEDSENKLIKIGHLCRRLNLTAEQRAMVDANTAVVTLQGVQDLAAIAEMERHAAVFKPDIICVNPLTSFLSKGVYDEPSLNDFIRVWFPSILRKLNCGGLPIHHPPKPSGKNPNDQTIYEIQYMGAGMASITNACRGNLLLLPVDGDVFCLCGGKGFHELGWTEDRIYLRRSVDDNGDWLWLLCESDKAEAANERREKRVGKKDGGGNGPSKFIPYERLLKLMNPTRKYSRESVRELVKKEINRGKDWADDALKELTAQKKLVKSTVKNPEGGAFVFYQLPTVLEPAE
jgi:hypothetical protein